MIIFAKADGTVIDVITTPVYQGSNISGSIYFVAPLPPLNAVTVAFKLPNGINTQNYRMTSVSELDGVTDKFGKEYNVWEWQDKNAEVTTYAGVCVAQFGIYLPNGQLLTTSRTSFEVQAGVLDEPPETPSEDVYALILRYLAQLEARTQNVPYLVRSIQKVAGNAFSYTDNSGGVSEPVVIQLGEDAPIPVNTGSKVTIPKYLPGSTTEYAWQEQQDNGNVVGYTYTVMSGMHGQIRDGATANDLWVSLDTSENEDFLGTYARYTVNISGDITIYANEPVAMTVRVWNGKSIVDKTARTLIANETTRAENAEKNLQSQIDHIEQSGVDLTAREQIADETARAKAEETAIQASITAEIQRAQETEQSLQTAVSNNAADIEDLQATVEHIQESGVISVNGQTGDVIIPTTYDLEIKTQAEFETFYAMLDAGACTAESVLLFGDNGAFIRNDGKGLKLPATLYRLDGINNATIEVTQFVYNAEANKAAVWYETLSVDNNHSISNITVKCEGSTNITNGGMDAYGFCNCTNLTNCISTAFGKGYLFSFPPKIAYGCGFYNCVQLINCAGTGVGVRAKVSLTASGGGYGFSKCSYCANCKNGETESSDETFDLDCTYVSVTTTEFSGLALETDKPRGTIYSSMESTSPAELFGGTWAPMEVSAGPPQRIYVSDAANVPQGQYMDLCSYTIPTNTIAYISGYTSLTTSESGVMNLCSLTGPDIDYNVRTDGNNGGGCSVSIVVETTNQQKLITLRTYGYKAYRVQGRMNILLIPKGTGYKWQRTT